MRYLPLDLPDGTRYNLKLTQKQIIKIKKVLDAANKAITERQGGESDKNLQG